MRPFSYCIPSQPPNLTLPNIPPQIALGHRIPPREQRSQANQPKPRRELEIPPLAHLRRRVGEQLFELRLAHPRGVPHLVHVDIEIGLCFNEEYVVDFVLAPLPIRGRQIVYPGQELEIRDGDLLGFNAEFMAQFPLSCAFCAFHIRR